jgi:hypothetical protein
MGCRMTVMRGSVAFKFLGSARRREGFDREKSLPALRRGALTLVLLLPAILDQ